MFGNRSFRIITTTHIVIVDKVVDILSINKVKNEDLLQMQLIQALCTVDPFLSKPS